MQQSTSNHQRIYFYERLHLVSPHRLLEGGASLASMLTTCSPVSSSVGFFELQRMMGFISSIDSPNLLCFDPRLPPPNKGPTSRGPGSKPASTGKMRYVPPPARAQEPAAVSAQGKGRMKYVPPPKDAGVWVRPQVRAHWYSCDEHRGSPRSILIYLLILKLEPPKVSTPHQLYFARYLS